jgi:hypothetical protein
MSRDYYVILGIPSDAAPGAVRSAFRRLARRYHPDRGETGDARSFREVAEAYGVLSDPERRARYDRRTLRRVRPAFHRAPTEPEPLISEPVPVAASAETVRPSLDSLVDRLARNFAGEDVPKFEHPEPLEFELILSPDEADRGVRVPFRIPLFRLCGLCGGSGRDWLLPCRDCDGEGRVVEPTELHVDLPAGVRDGARVDVALDDLGVHNLWLSLHVRVARI